MSVNYPVIWSSTKISGSNALGSSGVQVLSQNSQRVAVTFHNPGSVSVYVYSSQTSPTPVIGSLGGSYVVLAGADITLYAGNTMSIGAVNGTWSAFAASGSSNPLTIMEMML